MVERRWVSDNGLGRFIVLGMDDEQIIFSKRQGNLNVRLTNAVIIYTDFTTGETELRYSENLSLTEDSDYVYERSSGVKIITKIRTTHLSEITQRLEELIPSNTPSAKRTIRKMERVANGFIS